MLITPEYQEQCRLLHKTNEGWGDNSYRVDITPFLDYCKELQTEDVLDYGCGKGKLGLKFPFPVKEYDPGIPGKEHGNVPSDLVICLDTLEHIEFSCLKDVLEDLWRCTKKLLHCSIATGPAVAILPDGRNAHLIQQDWEWWKKRLEIFFVILGSETIFKNSCYPGTETQKTEIQCLLAPRKPQKVGLGTPTLLNFDGEERPLTKEGDILNLLDYEMVEFGPYQPVAFFPENLEYSVKTIKKWWDYSVDPEASKKKVAIVGYGPSLHDSLESLKQGNYDVIISTSGGHNVCLDNGIKPTHHVEIDWKPHKYRFTENAQDGIKYLISSVCNPKTIDNVKDKDSYVIFIEHGDQIKYPEGATVLQSGYDVGQHAVILAEKMGYKNLDLFGFDYCFDMDNKRHAGPHGGRVHHLIKGRVGDKLFHTSKTMFAALLVFEFWLKNNPEMNVRIFSDTLLINFLEGRIAQLAAEQQKLGV